LEAIHDVQEITTLPVDGEQYDPNAKSIEDAIAEIVAEIPAEAWGKVPADGSVNVDHYLYGTPKR